MYVVLHTRPFKLLTALQYFIRQNTASTIARRMQYLNDPLKRATQYVVDELRAADGDGGVIAIDDAGNGESRLLDPTLRQAHTLTQSQ